MELEKLITDLKEMPFGEQDDPVYAWCDGDRVAITGINTSSHTYVTLETEDGGTPKTVEELVKLLEDTSLAGDSEVLINDCVMGGHEAIDMIDDSIEGNVDINTVC